MHDDALPRVLDDRQFEILVRRLADDLRFGQDNSPYIGAGIDYVQTRPFLDEDAVGDIDWKVTARTGRYHVKEYEAPKATPIYLVVDTSASMAISSQTQSKHGWATVMAGGLAFAALRRMSPIGLLGAGDRWLHFRPSLSRARVMQWLHELRWLRFDEQTRLTDRLEQLRGLLGSHSVVVVISDLHDLGAPAAIRKLSQRHEMLVLHLEDPAERGRLFGGFFRGREAETGRGFVAHSRSRWFHRAAPVKESLTAAGVEYLSLPTDRPVLPMLRRFMAERGAAARNIR